MRRPLVRMVQHPGLGTVAFPGLPTVPTPIYPSSMVRADQAALGATGRGSSYRAADDPMFAGFNKVPANYVISIVLAGAPNSTAPGTVTLRPEPFILERITWATNGDTFPYVDQEPGYSVQGRSVRMRWGDEFTKLFGNSPAFVSAAMGDSNGYLDVVKGILFQGGQTLDIALSRTHWPSTQDVADTVWDFVFSGLALLPPGVNQSGSAG